MPRSLQEILDRADEYADRFEHGYEPRVDTTTPEMLIRRAAWKRARVEQEMVAAVAAARASGVAWRAIGEALGTSAQAAQKRYGKVLADADPNDASVTPPATVGAEETTAGAAAARAERLLEMAGHAGEAAERPRRPRSGAPQREDPVAPRA